jgi:lysophospholipase L1-like esterase
VHAVSGATLRQCVALVQHAAHEALQDGPEEIVVVACAGENDLSEATTLEESCQSLRDFLAATFDRSGQDCLRLIFLGPKFEPWLERDQPARRDYIRMSQAFEKICLAHVLADRIQFVDCLVMFCGESGHQPGALFGGKAKAERVYFDHDNLHLSEAGYRLWKAKVEACINSMLLSI